MAPSCRSVTQTLLMIVAVLFIVDVLLGAYWLQARGTPSALAATGLFPQAVEQLGGGAAVGDGEGGGDTTVVEDVASPEAEREASITLTGAASAQPFAAVQHHVATNFSKMLYPTHLDDPVMRRIWNHQNPEDCGSKKFLIWPFPGAASTRNVGSIMTNAVRWFATAMVTDRIFIYDDADWHLADCQARDHSCYFERISRCRREDLLALPKDQLFHIPEEALGSAANFDDIRVKHHDKTVWIAPSNWFFNFDSNHWDTMARMLNADTMYRNTCVMFSHLMTYILRPNPWMTQQIEAKLAGSFPSDFDPMRAVGLPIRGSDKCIGHAVEASAGGETACDPPSKYMQLANRIREWDPAVDTLLLTSEDPKVVEKVLALNAEARARGDFQWKVVLNKGDVMQGSGSATFFYKQSTLAKPLAVSEQVVSSFSSLFLQMRSRYLLTSSRTSFHILMAMLHQRDRCTLARDRTMYQIETALTFHGQPQFAYNLVICGN